MYKDNATYQVKVYSTLLSLLCSTGTLSMEQRNMDLQNKCTMVLKCPNSSRIPQCFCYSSQLLHSKQIDRFAVRITYSAVASLR